MAFPSLLSPHFCNLIKCAAAARACLLAGRLNEFQFPGFITQPGGGTCGSTKTCQNFSVFLSTGSVRFIVEVSSILHSLFSSGPWHFPAFSLDRSPRQLVVNSNQQVVIPCKYNTEPGKQPDIRWKKDGLLLDLPSRGRRLLSNGSLVVEGGEAGSYRCVASLPGVGTILSTVTQVEPAGESDPSSCPQSSPI